MTEYEFSKKPHRMTAPPANRREMFVGYDGTHCKLETDPVRIAVLCREATWGSVYDYEPTPQQIEETLAEIATGKVLGAAFEVPALAFVMRGSRATMDQLLRLRESAGASHTTRDNDFRDFNIIVPNTIAQMEGDREVALPPGRDRDLTRAGLWHRVNRHIESMRNLYADLVDAGIPPQDARYIALPMGYQGDWVQVMNMRALIKECEQRLCNGLTQHESNWLVRLQRDLVVEQWPHMDKLLRSSCEKRGTCVARSMLFPPCGAFGMPNDGFIPQEELDQQTAFERAKAAYGLEPDRYLYHPRQNDAQIFAEWDRDRVQRETGDEKMGLRIHYRFAGPPDEAIADTTDPENL